jgi:hypothetical protein
MFAAKNSALSHLAPSKGSIPKFPMAVSEMENRGGKWLKGKNPPEVVGTLSPFPIRRFRAPPTYKIESGLSPTPHLVQSKMTDAPMRDRLLRFKTM